MNTPAGKAPSRAVNPVTRKTVCAGNNGELSGAL